MKQKMKNVVLMIFLLFSLSCNTESVKEEIGEQDTVIILKDTLQSDTVAQIEAATLAFPKLVYFKQAECQQSCYEEKLVRKQLSNDTLIAEMYVQLNCETKYMALLESKTDAFNLKLTPIPTQVVELHDGKWDTISTIVECYCIYSVLMKAYPVKHIPQKLLVNGDTLWKNIK